MRRGAAGLWLDETREHSMFKSRALVKEYGILVLLPTTHQSLQGSPVFPGYLNIHRPR